MIKTEAVNSYKQFAKGIGIVILYFALPYLLMLPFALFKIYDPTNSNLINSLIYLALQGIMLLIICFIFRQDLKTEYLDFKKNYQKYLTISLKIWFVGLLLMMLSNWIIAAFITNSSGAANEMANRDLMQNFPLFAFPAIMIIAPIIEELVFRKSFKKAFSQMLPFVIFTGLAFGGIHIVSSYETLSDLLYLIPYGALGIALGYMYYQTNNIVANISIHIIHNTFTVSLILISWLLRYL
ncbi:MAG TPA: CPBP family intramembrane metalloprotease [Bacilli bacterium]|nr:CPBP family intramembrane metalloprotease [Bacilli bacterium]